jgi:hypothetical protein
MQKLRNQLNSYAKNNSGKVSKSSIRISSRIKYIREKRPEILQGMEENDIIEKLTVQYYDIITYKESTGLRVLNWISHFNPNSVNVYGFDWKESPTFYDNSKLIRFNDKRHGHNYFLEMDYCMNIFHNNFGYTFHN